MIKKDQASHPEFIYLKEKIFDKYRFAVTDLLREEESAAYGAYTFTLNDLKVRFRAAKITPTKTGQFVTLWKRDAGGPIKPFDKDDPIDLFIISVNNKVHKGNFVFPKSILFEKGILSNGGKDGKRAIRVYPPWDNNLNSQASQTQKWQLNYFIDLSKNTKIDSKLYTFLYSNNKK